MKRLISQNGVNIDSSKEFKVFECNHCGAVFESDEYIVEGFIEAEKDNTLNTFTTIGKVKLIDNCFTCMEECIIIEDKVED